MSGFLSRILERQRPQFFLWWPIALGTGAGLYFALPFEPAFNPILGTCFVAIAVGIFHHAPRLWPRALTMLVILVALGMMLASSRAHRLAAPVLKDSFIGTVEGRVVLVDRSQSNRLRVTLDHVTLYGLGPEQTPKKVRVTLPSKSAKAQTGRNILIFARLERPGAPIEPGGFDFRKWAWFKQLGGVGYALGPMMQAYSEPPDTFVMRITKLRYSFADFIRRKINGRNGAFAAAILAGERSAIDPALLDNLRASNLAHLLAISGLHMGLVTGFVFGLTRYGIGLVPKAALHFNAKKIGAACAIPAGLAYLVISGASVATQRAYIMALVVLIAVLLDRPAFTLRAVALAALVILIIAPESVTEAGFQLSFAATIGLVAGFDALRHTGIWKAPVRGWRKLLKGFGTVAFSSAIAGLATAPFAAFHFNQIAQYGLLANVLAVPLMGLLVMPCALTGLILDQIGLGDPFFLIAGYGIGGILEIAQFVAELDGSVIKVHATGAAILPLLAIGCLIFVVWRGFGRLAGPFLAAIALGLWATDRRPDLLIDETGAIFGVMADGKRVISRPKGQGFVANSWLESDGDDVEQRDAFARRKFSTTKESVALKNDATVILVKGNNNDINDLCRKNKVIIAPDVVAKSNGNCEIFDRDRLTEFGAIALNFDDFENWVGAKTKTKHRIWAQ